MKTLHNKAPSGSRKYKTNVGKKDWKLSKTTVVRMRKVVANDNKEKTCNTWEGWQNMHPGGHGYSVLLKSARRLEPTAINSVSKVIQDGIGFTLLRSCDWSRKLAPSSPPIRFKSITSRNFVTRLFPRLGQFFFFKFELSWTLCDISSVLRGLTDYFEIVFLRHSIEMCSNEKETGDGFLKSNEFD